MLKDKTFSQEAEDVLESTRKIYQLYHSNFDNSNASWDDVCKELKASKNTKVESFKDLFADFREKQEELAFYLSVDVYKYGFLPSNVDDEEDLEEVEENNK